MRCRSVHTPQLALLSLALALFASSLLPPSLAVPFPFWSRGTPQQQQTQTLSPQASLSARLSRFLLSRRAAPPPDLSLANQLAPVCRVAGANPQLKISAKLMSKRVWKGWGTSLAWFANYIGTLPSSQQKPILDLLFSKTEGNLGLNIIRYNIGGGFNPKNSPQFTRNDPYKWRGMPGYKFNASTPYNWSSDAAQRAVLQGAKDRGANIFVAFSNSPPWYMTVSGDVAGAVKKTSNIRDDSIQAFADYLADVTEHFAKFWGINFQFLAPVNEPASRWFKGGLQEGCSMSSTQVATLVPAVSKALKKRKLNTTVALFDDYPVNTVAYTKAVPASVLANITPLHVHGYESGKYTEKNRIDKTAADYANVAATAAGLQKELWVSEWGPNAVDGTELGLALYMSRMIIESVNIMNASSWAYWQPLDLFPRWTLITSTWNASNTVKLKYSRTKKFFALAQFTTLVPQGSIPIAISSASNCNFCTAAFFVPCRKQLVFVAVNQLTGVRAQLMLDGFKKAVGGQNITLTIYRTSATENFTADLPKPLKDIRQTIVVPLVAKSLTTLVIGGVISRTVSQNACGVLS